MDPLKVARLAKVFGTLVVTVAGRVVIKYGPKVIEKGKEIIKYTKIKK